MVKEAYMTGKKFNPEYRYPTGGRKMKLGQESSMHGLTHVTAKGRHPIERYRYHNVLSDSYFVLVNDTLFLCFCTFLWLVILLACVTGAIWLPLSSWKILQRRPTVINMERDYTSWNTSFPALTVCPESHVGSIELQLVTSRLVHRLENVSAAEVTFFLTTLADITINNIPGSVLGLLENLPGIEPEEFLQMLIEMAPNWPYKMKGLNEEEGEDIEGVEMDPVVTERGLCYSFNSALAPFLFLSSENQTWTKEDRDRILSAPVVRVNPLDGRVIGQLTKVSSGFTIFLHGPYEIADVSSVGIKVPTGHIKTLGLSALEVLTTPEAGQLSLSDRKCRLTSEEASGASPPVYSFVLCKRRCRARLAKRLCGCVPHWDTYLKEGKICDVKGIGCLANYQEALLRIQNPVTGEDIDCACLPSCDYVSYVVENEEVTSWFLGAGLEYGLSKYPRARLVRDVFFTPKDVLVSFGSAAGLFLGCSVLSFVEFLYFFTLGLYWYIQKRKIARIGEDKKNENDAEEKYNVDDEADLEANPRQRRFMSAHAWRRHIISDSGDSRIKLLPWIK